MTPRQRAPLSPPSAGLARWAWGGAALGTLLGGLAFAPAAWLAQAVHSATHGRLQLAQAEGTLWQGSAVPVLTGGEGSRDATLLPSRLNWQLRPSWRGLQASLQQDCCIPQAMGLSLQPGWSSWSLQVHPGANQVVGQWPAAWLEGLGAPLNTLRPAGHLRLVTRDLQLSQQGGKLVLQGQADLDLLQTSSRLSTLSPLGSYRISFGSDATGATTVQLSTLEGALQLSGQGQVDAKGLHLRGQARAGAGHEAALNNLLNIIGRRDGATSLISIG